MSAPASTQAHARSIAACRPSTASASVRAMMTKSGSVRASTAALIAVDHLVRATRAPCPAGGRSAWRRPGPRCASRAAPNLISELDRARDVERRRAEAGVDVDQQRQRADVGDPAHVGQHVVEVADAEVGHAERARGDAAAGEVDRLEARALGEERVVGADRAGHLQRLLGGERGAEARAGGGCGHRATVESRASAEQRRDAGALFLELLQRRVHPLARERRRSRRPLTRVYSPPARGDRARRTSRPAGCRSCRRTATPIVTHLPSLPSTQSRTWSIAALAADAADDRPRASMIAAPRLPTVGQEHVAVPVLVVDQRP